MHKTSSKLLRWLIPVLLLLLLLLVSTLLALYGTARGSTQTTAAPTPYNPTPVPTAHLLPVITPAPTPNPSLIPETPLVWSYQSGSGVPIAQYTFGTPVPETEAVDPEYFSDTAFIGDSRTQGLQLYSGLKTATFLAGRSINVSSIYTDAVIPDGNGGYETILDALADRQYRKIYIMLGVNELGYSQDNFIALYGDLIDEIARLQPDALLYIQAIIPVSKTRGEGDPYYNNTRIRAFNAAIAEMAAAKGAYYIDTYGAFADEEGNLPEDATFDGVHFLRDYCERWLQYIQTHTIEPVDFA